MSEILVTTEIEYLEEDVPLLETLELGQAEVLEVGGAEPEVIEVVVDGSQEILAETATEVLTEQNDVLELLETTPVETELLEVAEQGPIGPAGPAGPQGDTGPAGIAGPAAPPDWADYATQWDTPPVDLGGGAYSYTWHGVTRYRFVPEPYVAAQDAFFSDIERTDLIAARGI